MDIQQIMQLMGQGGGGINADMLPMLAQMGQGQPSPLGMLQPGRDPRGPGGGMGGGQFGNFGNVAPPDFNAILYKQMMQEQQDRQAQMLQQRAMRGTLGAGGLQPPMPAGPPPQAQAQPMPFQPAPPQPMTQPAGVASLPGGGLPSALGMAGQALGQRMAPPPRNMTPY